MPSGHSTSQIYHVRRLMSHPQIIGSITATGTRDELTPLWSPHLQKSLIWTLRSSIASQPFTKASTRRFPCRQRMGAACGGREPRQPMWFLVALCRLLAQFHSLGHIGDGYRYFWNRAFTWLGIPWGWGRSLHGSFTNWMHSLCKDYRVRNLRTGGS